MSKVKFSERGGSLLSRNIPGILSAIVVIIVLAFLGLLLFNRANDTDQLGAETAGNAAATTDEPGVAEAEAGDNSAIRQYDAPPPMTIDPEQAYTATVETPRGDIIIELLPEIAPQTVNNFVFLARDGFYDGLTWHRVLEDFMAQGGDPEGTGMGGPGYNVPAEFTDQITFDQPGLVAMARSQDPDSAGSQFFITTGRADWLDGQYTIFGRVIEGQEIVNSIPLRDPMTATEPGEEIVSITITEEG